MDSASFHRLNEERRAYFPAERNRVPAHVSLFHQLPGEEWGRIDAVLNGKASPLPPFEVRVAGLRSLGSGISYVLESPQLVSLRTGLSGSFAQWLTRQDKQKYQPHVTIQNKVSSEEAKSTLTRFQATFSPFTMKGIGLCLWRYLGGDWELESSYLFCGSQAINVAGPISP